MPRDCVGPTTELTAGIRLDRNQFRISRPTELGSHARANPGKLCKNKLHIAHICKMHQLRNSLLGVRRANIDCLLLFIRNIHETTKETKSCFVWFVIQHILNIQYALHHKPFVDLINKVQFSPQVRKIQDKVKYGEGV